MWPDGYADKSMRHEQSADPLESATPEHPAVDWRSLYLAERQRTQTLEGLLRRRHSLDPVEVAEALSQPIQKGSNP